MEKTKKCNILKKINLENVLCLFIILCPILDMASFIFRNIFNTNFSPSTFIRPIIPIVSIIYLFFKNDKKFKFYTIGIGIIYLIYGLIHLIVFKTTITGSSYSTVKHEAQYIVNYTFMILNLFIYIYVFSNNQNEKKLSKSVLIASLIYIVSIYVSILTKTSSRTYIEEEIGYKGWFESGNSIGAILILSLFIIMTYIKDKNYRKIAIPVIILIGVFLTTLLGTRVGLFGFIITIITYTFVETVITLINKGKINKKTIAMSIATIFIILLVAITIGSATLQRRKNMKDVQNNIVDENLKENSHVTGDLLEIINKINKNELEEGYMNEPQKKSIIDLYNKANEMNIANNDQRMQELIYNIALVKNQKSFVLIIFGNGYVSNFRELILEMEIPAFLFNFGIMGFILYFMPFVILWGYSIYKGMKNIKEIDAEYLMLLLGSGFVFALSFFAGYTFFNSSSMIIIIVLNTLLINKVNKFKRKM